MVDDQVGPVVDEVFVDEVLVGSGDDHVVVLWGLLRGGVEYIVKSI